MENAPAVAEPIAHLEVAALAMATGEVLHPGRAVEGAQEMRKPHPSAADLAPIVPNGKGDQRQGEEEGRNEDRDERVMGQMGVEPGAALGAQGGQGPKEEGQRDDQKAGHGDAMGLEQPRQGAGAGQALPAFHPHLGRSRRYVEGEFVRRGVLARIVTASAIMAEVGQLRQVAFGKGFLTGHRRKDRAEAFTVAAGVADLHDARHFGFVAGQRFGQRLGPPGMKAHRLLGGRRGRG